MNVLLAPRPVVGHGLIREKIDEVSDIEAPNVLVLRDASLGIFRAEELLLIKRLESLPSDDTEFYVVDTASHEITTRHTFQFRGDEEIEASIKLRANISDPVRFVRTFGVSATLIDPIYDKITLYLTEILFGMSTNNIAEIQAKMQESVADLLKKDKAFSDCVFVSHFLITLSRSNLEYKKLNLTQNKERDLEYYEDFYESKRLRDLESQIELLPSKNRRDKIKLPVPNKIFRSDQIIYVDDGELADANRPLLNGVFSG